MAGLSRIDSHGNRLTTGGRRKRTLLALASLLILAASTWWWLTPQGASAHANLASAEPAPNSELETAPERIIIWFTEPIEPSLSSIQVLDSTGERVDLDNSEVDDLNPLVMSVGLDEVPEGTYTVAWSNVSTVDGHRVRGSFVFAVGQPLSASPMETVEQPLLQSPFSPVLRWLILLAALAMVGGPVFDGLVARPALLGNRAVNSVADVGRSLSATSLRLVALAAGLFLVASAGQLLLVTTITQEVTLWGAFVGPLRDTVAATDWGGLWVWRMAAALGFGVAIAGLRFVSELWRPAITLLAIGLGGAVLWRLTLTSHGAATVDIRNLAIAADFLHLGSLIILGRRPVPFRSRGIAFPHDTRRGTPGKPSRDVAEILGHRSDERGRHRGNRGVQRLGPGYCYRGPQHSVRSDSNRQGCPGIAAPVPGRTEPGMGADTPAP